RIGDEELAHVLSGRHPESGRPLVVRPGTVAGYDLTFAAPKSVSVLLALAGPDAAAAVEVAHDVAVDRAVGYVDRRALAVRRGDADERVVVPTDGAIGAAFTHRVSRALDPHLHTHVVVANVARGPDGRWTGIDGRGLFAHAAAAGQLYDAELRQGLSTALGVSWSVGAAGRYEVDGIGADVIGAFSGRRAEIDEHRTAHGSTSRRGARVAWAVTRDPPADGVDFDDLRGRWAARVVALGFERSLPADRGRLSRPPRNDGPGREARAVDEYRFAAVLGWPDRAAARRDVVGAWAGGLAAGAAVADVERCVDALVGPDDAIGVAERRQGTAGLVPTSGVLRALGPRPERPEQLAEWQLAATDIDRYRTRWAVADPTRALGIDGAGTELSRLPVARLADYLEVSRRVAETRRQLGRPPLGRTAFARDGAGPDRGLGR
ncbi:MAG TPA: MobF family relaxase, partial [Acidimicrobiales bacterium]|nr:MobF family relaxase [Acidimicrobiales bacterium]